jgi:hypothetical protein
MGRTRPAWTPTQPNAQLNRLSTDYATALPGERLIVRGGVRTHPDARPIYGTVQIPAGAALEDGCLNRQTLWSRFWTPLGELTMAFPANMSGVVTRLTAPLGTQLYADRPIPLHDGEGEHVGTIYDCSNIEFMSPPPSNE